MKRNSFNYSTRSFRNDSVNTRSRQPDRNSVSRLSLFNFFLRFHKSTTELELRQYSFYGGYFLFNLCSV